MKEIDLSIREIQKLEFDVLKFIKEVCREYNLRYYLAYGTLIGAVRHNGFIPWDDDIDIMMPRKDYNIFIEAMKKKNHPYYKLISKETNKDFNAPLPKVVDSRIELKQNYSFIEKVVLGPYVDIFILDGCGENNKEAIKNFDMCYTLFKKWLIADTDFLKFNKQIKSLIKSLVFLPIKIKGYDYYLERLSKKSSAIEYDDSNYVGTLMFPTEENSDEIKKYNCNIWLKKQFGNGTELLFESERFKVPEDYDGILRDLFGDYMKLPPKNERVSSHDFTLKVPDDFNIENIFKG